MVIADLCNLPVYDLVLVHLINVDTDRAVGNDLAPNDGAVHVGRPAAVVFQFGICFLLYRTAEFNSVHIQSTDPVVHEAQARKTQRFAG